MISVYIALLDLFVTAKPTYMYLKIRTAWKWL